MKDKIYVAGHHGMVGSSIIRELLSQGYKKNDLIIATHDELDLTNQQAVIDFIKSKRPNQIYLAAGKVGGILANSSFPAEFIYQNLMIEANIINAAFQNKVNKLLFLGSSCIYPKYASQPIKESKLLTGILEPTNEPYAIAKIAGIKLCEAYNRQYKTDYRSVMPTNLYGQGDNYHPQNSHVIPALIRRFHEAKEKKKSKVLIWGSGNPKREFLYVDDLAGACVHVMNLEKKIFQKHTLPTLSHINVGSGQDLTIARLASIVSKVVGFQGKIEYDIKKPDGTPRKLLDCSIINKLGWSSKISLEQGLKLTYKDFNINNIKL